MNENEKDSCLLSFLTNFSFLSLLSIEPCPGHQIVAIQYSHTGSTFVVAGEWE